MIRNIIPFILANVGITFIIAASFMPVFEWQIDEVVTDFPSTYKMDAPPSTVYAGLGDSLDDKSFVFRRFYVMEGNRLCSAGNMNSVAKRSWNEAMLEQMLLWVNINPQNVSWLLGWGLIEVALSGIYIWWSTIWHEHRRISDAINSTILAGIFAMIFFCFVQISVLQIMGPDIDFGFLNNCRGTLEFSAHLSKMHYETLTILFAGILSEAGAFGIMLRRVIVAANKRKESANSVVS